MGYAFMYSRQVQATNNLSSGDRTHGIFLNYVTDCKLAHNDIRDGGVEVPVSSTTSTRRRSPPTASRAAYIGVHFTGVPRMSP